MVHRITATDDGPNGLVLTTQGDDAVHPGGIAQGERLIGNVVFLISAVGTVAPWVLGR